MEKRRDASSCHWEGERGWERREPWMRAVAFRSKPCLVESREEKLVRRRAEARR